MQYNRYLFPLLLQLITPFFLLSQNIGIHAEPVGEWTSKAQFSPEYHYNSVAVYLLNEDRLLDLFDPENLTKEERKLTGVRNFDVLESIYFSLELPNPRKEDDIIHFPLYAFDIHNSKSFQVPRNQGKILDRITDEELNGIGLEAKAKIEAIKKNQLLEVAYQISSSVNKILGDRIFHNPGISGVMRKAQEFFEDKYRGKIVSEFTVPILPGNADFEYRLHSASIYQVKWDFQEKLRLYKGSIWSDLVDRAEVTEEQLKDRPSRLIRYNKHPYLVVVRYKSAYSLPEAHKLNVKIDQPYLDKRLYNLTEFRKNGNQYKAEEAFLAILRDAIDLQRNCENYIRGKQKGDLENELLMQIAQQNFELLNAYKKEVARNQGDEERKKYFEDNYTVTYYKFFKLLDNILFQDPQLKEIGKIPNLVETLYQKDLERTSPQELYSYLKQLETYRKTASQVAPIEGDLFYKTREVANRIETIFQSQVFNVPALGDKQQRVEKFTALKKQYPLCVVCVHEADHQISLIQQSIDDERRSALFALQNQQLKYRKCFSDIQLTALQQLGKRYPQQDSLTELKRSLYEAYLQKIHNLKEAAAQFQEIGLVKVEKLPSEKLLPTLTVYQTRLANFKNEACQLIYGELLDKEALSCLGGDCKMAIP
ncbi:MAG: hypothetical protein AAF960_04320 [Bacteroidota bacterium]